MTTILDNLPALNALLPQLPAASARPWSTCELRLDEERLAELSRQLLDLPRLRFDRFLQEQALVTRVAGHPMSSRRLLGLALTIVMSEFGRRDATEGCFWTAIARRFVEAAFYTRLFTSTGQPTSLSRELLEQTARGFNLRHIYGLEGHHSWYSSLLLQFGFTRKGFERRLAEWLAGQIPPLAVQMLLYDPRLRAASFHQLWDALWNYRRGNRTTEQTRNVLTSSCWALPGWADTLLRAAKERRELDALPQGDDWESEADDSDSFLSVPFVVWEPSSSPCLRAEVVRLAELSLEAPEYTIRIADQCAGRLLRQSDGSYRTDNGGMVSCPLVPGVIRAELVGPLEEVTASQELEVSDPHAEVTLFNAGTGTQVVEQDGSALAANQSYLLLLSEDLEVIPKPVVEHRCGETGFKLVALPALTAGLITVSLEGEILWELGVTPRRAVDCSEVKLVWGNRFDDGNAGAGYVRLLLPAGWELRRARKDFRTLDFTELPGGGLQSEAFAITPDDHVRDARFELHLRHHGHRVRKSCRLSIPSKGVLWQKRGEQEYKAFDPEKPLYTFSAHHDRFLFRLMEPRGMSDQGEIGRYYRNHVLMEGVFFHRRLGKKPVSLGQLHGFGQQLVVKAGAFNSNEIILKVADAVFDTGILTMFKCSSEQPPAVELRSPISPSAEHQLLVVGTDLKVTAHPFAVVEGTKNHRLVITTPCFPESHVAIGLFYRGVRLGSLWKHQETHRLGEHAAAGEEEALHVARVIRVFKLPVLSNSYFRLGRSIALENIAAFVAAWIDEQPIVLDGIELKSPGLDEGAAYAFSELMQLDPFSFEPAAVDELVEMFAGQDCLRQPEWALTMTATELSRLSPLLAATVVKQWQSVHSAHYPPGVTRSAVLPGVRAQLLGGQTEEQLVAQVSQALQADEHFVRRHLQTRLIPAWKSNVRSMQHLLPFRMLLTRAFLNGL